MKLNKNQMTCIVGIVKDGITYMGADSAGVWGLNVTVRKDPKIFRVGDFVIGCTSSFRMIQLLRFSMNPPKLHKDEDIYQYMCTSFVNELRRCFRDGGFMTVDKNVEEGGTFLVGWRDRLFEIEDDFQVAENLNGMASIGCGHAYAIGAMSAYKEDENLPENILMGALKIAEFYNGGVRAPFTFISTKN